MATSEHILLRTPFRVTQIHDALDGNGDSRRAVVLSPTMPSAGFRPNEDVTVQDNIVLQAGHPAMHQVFRLGQTFLLELHATKE